MRSGGGLDELDQDAAGVLGVHEVDPAVGGAALGGVVQKSQPPVAQGRAHRLDVLHPEGQLLQPLSPDTTIGRFLDKGGPGIQQMAYRVDDLDEVSAHLRGQGMRLLYDAPKTGTAGSRVNFVHPKDAGGVLVELVQPA